MKTRKQLIILISLIFSLMVVWTFGATRIVRAGSLNYPGVQSSDEVLDNDVFVTGQKIALEGTVNGDVVILANRVEVNGTVNGSLLVIG